MSQQQTEATACPVCGEEFPTEHGMKVHRGHAHGAHREVCVRCGEEFKIAPSQAQVRQQCRQCFRQYGFSKLTRNRIGRGVKSSKKSTAND